MNKICFHVNELNTTADKYGFTCVHLNSTVAKIWTFTVFLTFLTIAKLSIKHKNVKQSKLYKKATENESLRKCVLCFVVTRESSISRVSLWSV